MVEYTIPLWASLNPYNALKRGGTELWSDEKNTHDTNTKANLMKQKRTPHMKKTQSCRKRGISPRHGLNPVCLTLILVATGSVSKNTWEYS
jgi:hypothetical protein